MFSPPLRHIVSLVVGALAVGMLSGCTGLRSSPGGCSERDERFATTLADLPILSAHPDGVTPTGSSWRCDTDDGFAEVSRRYQTGIGREAIMGFYHAAATADEWRTDGKNSIPVASTGLVVSGAAECFHKEIDGTAAYLKVWFPGDLAVPGDPELHASTDVYGIDVTGSHDGTAWC